MCVYTEKNGFKTVYLVGNEKPTFVSTEHTHTNLLHDLSKVKFSFNHVWKFLNR